MTKDEKKAIAETLEEGAKAMLEDIKENPEGVAKFWAVQALVFKRFYHVEAPKIRKKLDGEELRIFDLFIRSMDVLIGHSEEGLKAMLEEMQRKQGGK